MPKRYHRPSEVERLRALPAIVSRSAAAVPTRVKAEVVVVNVPVKRQKTTHSDKDVKSEQPPVPATTAAAPATAPAKQLPRPAPGRLLWTCELYHTAALTKVLNAVERMEDGCSHVVLRLTDERVEFGVLSERRDLILSAWCRHDAVSENGGGGDTTAPETSKHSCVVSGHDLSVALRLLTSSTVRYGRVVMEWYEHAVWVRIDDFGVVRLSSIPFELPISPCDLARLVERAPSEAQVILPYHRWTSWIHALHAIDRASTKQTLQFDAERKQLSLGLGAMSPDESLCSFVARSDNDLDATTATIPRNVQLTFSSALLRATSLSESVASSDLSMMLSVTATPSVVPATVLLRYDGYDALGTPTIGLLWSVQSISASS